MGKYIYLITTFILLFCVGCGSVESGNMAGEDSYTNSTEKPQEEAQSDEQGDSNSETLESTDGTALPGNNHLYGSGGADSDQNNDSQNEEIEKEEIEYVAVHTEHVFEQYVDRETGNSLVDMNYQVISLEEGNETLEKTISRWMVKRQQDLEEEGLELMVKAKNKQKETGNEDLSASLWHEITLYRADNHLISFVERQYSYSIDSWDNNYRCVNFDVESGKSILLNDLLVNKEGFRKAVIEYCVEELENTYTNSEIDDAFVNEIYQSITTIENWCLDASGFVFVYEDDAMTYSNEGVIFVHVPYDVVLDYMNPKYLWGNTYGVAALTCDQTAAMVIDDVEQEIRVEKQYDEYYIEELQLIYGEQVIDMGKHLRTGDIYLVSHEKWNYLLVSADMGSEDYQTYFYQLQKDGIGKNFYLTGELDAANVRADSFHLGLRLDVFGTYQTYPDYFILEGGGVASYRPEFEIEHFSYDYCELETIRELPVVKDSTKISLPVGSRLRILATDNASWAKFLLLDSMEEILVYFDREEDYTISINGVSEYLYFKELPYAG